MLPGTGHLAYAMGDIDDELVEIGLITHVTCGPGHDPGAG
jgi:hypothetical protein